MTFATTYDDTNIFARILRGEIPCDRVMENDHVLAFRDIRPQAPVHILVIPKGRYRDAADFGANASAAEIEAFWRAVSQIAGAHGLTDRGFRIIANAGADGGQEVPHFHVHILGGKSLGAMVGK
ncbi:MAG: histidine triad nucleotide-binding protein [Proteobacteria bacterium]|nr:histidine triad nucleotide-binding protein [Pseudomonadota bacterium]